MSTPSYRYDFVDRGQGNIRRSIRTGSSWKKSFTIFQSDGVTPEPIGTWTFQMMIRKTASSDTVIIELSTANGRITLPNAGTDGKFILELTPALTAGLIDDIGINDYDLKATIGSEVRDLVEGSIEIRPSSTR